MKIPRHLRPLARRARDEGWQITVTGSGHLRWKPPRGPAVITGSTPGRYGHGPRNARRELARAGLGAERHTVTGLNENDDDAPSGAA